MTDLVSNVSTNKLSRDGGPLLPTLLMGNNNNDAAAQAAAGGLVADTSDPQNGALELNTPRSHVEAIDGNPSFVDNDGEDGPLLLGLLLNNQNNNNLAAAGNAPTSGGAIPDTLNPTNIALELKPSVGDGAKTSDLSIDVSNKDGVDGPLLFALILPNQNNNNGKNGNNNNNAVPPDTLNPTNIALELKSAINYTKETNENHGSESPPVNDDHNSTDAIVEAIPDVSEMKTQLLELHAPGNDITNSIPVVLKVDSEAQKAQILLALRQGRSIPVAIATGSTCQMIG